MGARKGEHRSPATEFEQGHIFSLKYKPEFADEMIKFFEDHEAVPFFEDYATRKGIVSRTLRSWAERYPRFKAAYERCEEIQRVKLLAGGLAGRFNPQIVKLIAMNKHGMSEKAEQKVDASLGGSDGLKVNITVLKPEKVEF